MKLPLLVVIVVLFCGGNLQAAPLLPQIGTREQRAEMFEDLVQKTLDREAFSDVKNQRLDLDVEQAMRECKDDIVDAKTDHELLIALNKFSCARRDRHLTLRPVKGGLRPAGKRPGDSPLQFAVDFREPRSCFVAVVGKSADTKGVAVGDVVVAVNGKPFKTWAEAVSPYLNSSTSEGLWGEYAKALGKQSGTWPTVFNTPTANYTLRRADGTEFDVMCQWGKRPTPRNEMTYPGDHFQKTLELQTFDLYVHKNANVLLIDWHIFGKDIVKDVDRLMDVAVDRDWLNHDIVWDGTRSGGGSYGAYAVQRLFDRPFKTTFGNIRLSDVVEPFTERMRATQQKLEVIYPASHESVIAGRRLLDWLDDDVALSTRQGKLYSENVPFKLAHLPKDSDGILQPADVHFQGRVVCLLGPHGGSHLDQFASIVIDNGLAHTIGMSTGGFSNTWEWQEIVTMPGTNRPLVTFKWSIGHTIRPNGEVLEGNPAKVDDYVPITRENYAGYRQHLVERALVHLNRK